MSTVAKNNLTKKKSASKHASKKTSVKSRSWMSTSQKSNKGWISIRSQSSKTPISTCPQSVIKERFERLKKIWKEETLVLSSTPRIVFHPAYQQIIGLGPDVLPLIFDELQNGPEHWFWALYSITGDNPVTEIEDGNMWAMRDAWLKWGKKHNYVR